MAIDESVCPLVQEGQLTLPTARKGEFTNEAQ
jgi:hypothetical protein